MPTARRITLRIFVVPEQVPRFLTSGGPRVVSITGESIRVEGKRFRCWWVGTTSVDREVLPSSTNQPQLEDVSNLRGYVDRLLGG